MLYQIFQQIGGIFGFAIPMFLPLETNNSPIVIEVKNT